MGKSNEISRRTVIGGMVTAAAMPVLAAKSLATGAVDPQPAAKAQSGFAGTATALPRHQHAAVALADGRVLVTGGYASQNRAGRMSMPVSSAQIFDPVNHTWQNVASMQAPRARHTAVALPDGRIAVLGGFSHVALDSVEIYDPHSDTWTTGPSLPMPMCDHSAVYARGTIVLHGGSAGLTANVLAVEPLINVKRP